MGKQSRTNPPRRIAGLAWAAIFLVFVMRVAAQSPDTSLRLPGSVAFDGSGNLFFAETANHVIRRLTPAGVLSEVAGTGTQGFGGDGGPATMALLDSPAAVAVDSFANLLIADTHNHRIRRVDASTGVITTYAMADSPVALAFDGNGNLVYADSVVHRIFRIDSATRVANPIAGNGVQGYAGDGGAATNASIDTPSGLVFDAAGDLFLCDSRNHRVRRVDVATGIISTVAGEGVEGFSGDGDLASSARLALPRGLALDASEALFIADAENHRIRRVDATTGQITTIAGTGVQGFSGDGSAAAAAALDRPRGVAAGAGGVITLADSSNERIRQVDSSRVIQTIAGVGAVTVARSPSSATLVQASPTILSGTVRASSGTPTGTIVLIDGVTQVASELLAAGNANFTIAALSTGAHTLSVRYGGDSNFLPSSSSPLVVTVAPPVSADFTLESSGPTALTIVTGGSATFSFTVTPTGALSSPIVLSASGLPVGATASFSPSVVPPPSAPTAFTVTISSPATARVEGVGRGKLQGSKTLASVYGAFLFGGLIWWPLGCWFPRRVRRRGVVGLAFVLLGAGCGNRTTPVTASSGGTAVSYNLTISGTATSASGATLLHSVQVTLTVE